MWRRGIWRRFVLYVCEKVVGGDGGWNIGNCFIGVFDVVF